MQKKGVGHVPNAEIRRPPSVSFRCLRVEGTKERPANKKGGSSFCRVKKAKRGEGNKRAIPGDSCGDSKIKRKTKNP